MRSDELLREVLQETGLPVKQYEYKGTQPAYLVINEEAESGADHADDLPRAISLWWQVHLFAPKNYPYRAMKRKIRRMLLQAGFGIGGMETLYETETGTVHVVISCSIVEGV